MEAQIQHNSDLNFEKVWAMFQETDQKFRESDRKFQEDMKKSREENDRQIKETRKFLSELGQKLGSVVEHMFIPNLHKNFHQFGYTFGKSSANVLIQDRVHQIHAEVDVFLENGDCAMAVEIKTQPNNNDIRDHVERMEKLRQWADLHDDKRQLYGAVAGAIIPDNVRDYALKQGFYVIEQSADTLNILAPDEAKLRVW
ncbi:hypothetical protein LQZ19_05035 [Treponema primitia]|uniref:hypothetical protein n=1 Tax=Treponema primitia TaxID=88058 RepID=UPI0039806118